MSDDGETDDISIKVVLLGETTVGKTSIITRYNKNSFSPYVMATANASFVIKKIEIDENNKITLKIWDTAGQERYRAVSKIIYKNASAVLLVYDITNQNSFNGIKEYWSKEIKENTPENTIIAIVANKSDEYLEQKVPTEDGKELAKQLNAFFISTSAKSGNGIDELFRTVAEKYLFPEKDISQTYMNKDEIEEKKNNIILEKCKKSKNKGKKKKKKCCE